MSTNLGNIKDKGGNKIAVVELDSSMHIPQTLVEGTNCLDLGHLASSELAVKTKRTVLRNEAGRTAATDFESEGLTSGILMETDKMKTDFLAFAVKNKRYLEYKYLGVSGGKYQESFKVCEITPQMKISAPGGAKSMPYESTAIVNDEDVTITQNDIRAITSALGITIRTTGSVTIPAGNEHVIVETSL